MSDATQPEPSIGLEQYREVLERQQETVIGILTGGNWDVLGGEYTRQRAVLEAAASEHGIESPFPWADKHTAWAWGKQWSRYHLRREAVWARSDPVFEQIDAAIDTETRAEGVPNYVEHHPNWERVSRRARKAIETWEQARDLDDHQEAGRIARESLKDAVKLSFRDEMLPDGVSLTAGDAVDEMFEFIANFYFSGESQAKARATFKKTWGLANARTHNEQPAIHTYMTVVCTNTVIGILQQIGKDENWKTVEV